MPDKASVLIVLITHLSQSEGLQNIIKAKTCINTAVLLNSYLYDIYHITVHLLIEHFVIFSSMFIKITPSVFTLVIFTYRLKYSGTLLMKISTHSTKGAMTQSSSETVLGLFASL